MTNVDYKTEDQGGTSSGSLRIQLCGESLQLHPLKAIYWEGQQVLILADLHLGKAAHFRQSGIPVPLGVSHANFDRLISLLLEYKPARVLILGDLFHSVYNKTWEELSDLISQFKHIRFQLVPGNHDILEDVHYQRSGLQILSTEWQEGPFLFSHFPIESPAQESYNLAGHIHPAVRLQGQGQQSLKLPCFYFGAEGGILPAFGAFTGTAVLSIQKEEHVFVITETEVLAV